MSMCLVMCTLSDENIERVVAYPPLIWRVISPGDPEPYESAAQAKPGFFSRLFGRRGEARTRPLDLDLADGEVVERDLDKAWHGIHFLLTGTAWEGAEPLNLLVGGGRPVGDVDVGYGPARVLTSQQVRRADGALREIDETTLRARFDPRRMMELEIYPHIWDRDPADDDVLAYCAEHFSAMKAFIADAAERRSGLVLYLV